MIVPALALALTAAALSWAVERLLADARWVQHSDQVIGRANECLRLGVDMETGVRGFQITGEPQMLEPYEAAARAIRREFEGLLEQVADNPAQLGRVRAAQAEHEAWASFARDLILRREQGGDYRSLEVNLRGKALFDRFRDAFSSFIAAEEELKRQRAERFVVVNDRLTNGRMGLLLLVGLGIGWYAWRQMAGVARFYHTSEESARLLAAEFQAIFDHASVGVVQLDPQTGIFLRANRAYCDLVGYRVDELVGLRTPDDLTHRDDRDLDRQKLGRMLRGQDERYASEKRYVRKDGEVRWVSVNAALVRDENGRPLRTVGVIVDLTARRAAEAALRASEDRLRLATEAANVGTWDWDIPTNVLTWSERARRMFGLPAESAMSYDEFLRHVHPEDRARVDAAVQRALVPASGGQYAVEFRTTAPESGARWVGSRGAVQFDASGRPVRFTGGMVDITELKNTAARLSEARDLLEQKVQERTAQLASALEKAQEVDRLKSEFLATMSHELRTPLNSVIGFTELLQAEIPGPVNAEQKRQLGFVHNSGKHLLHLINDLLDLARIESGKVEPAWETLAPAEVIHEAVETIRPLAQKKGLKLVVDVDPPATLRVDRKMLLQVLLNLLSNAVKFTERGEVTLRARQVDGQFVTAVHDTGMGIKPDQLTQLFEAFRQVDGSVQRRFEGTGLGLYLCKKILGLLGGTIHARSEFGRGSVFTFTLPLSPPS